MSFEDAPKEIVHEFVNSNWGYPNHRLVVDGVSGYSETIESPAFSLDGRFMALSEYFEKACGVYLLQPLVQTKETPFTITTRDSTTTARSHLNPPLPHGLKNKNFKRHS